MTLTADAINAQTAAQQTMAANIVTAVNALTVAIEGVSEKVDVLSNPVSVATQAVGGLFWVVLAAVAFILAYVVLRVLWNVVLRPILRY